MLADHLARCYNPQTVSHALQIRQMTTPASAVEKPPIIDVMILAEFRRSISTNEVKYAVKQLSKNGFSKSSQIIESFELEETEGEKKSQKRVQFSIETEDGEREVTITRKAVIYRDGRSYENRRTLITRFAEVWKLCGFESRIQEVVELRLRVINKFKLVASDIGEKILIYPVIHLAQCDPLMGPVDMQVHLRSEYRDANAIVNMGIMPRDGETVEMVLDIDTYIENSDFQDFASIETYISRLSDFKNDIFFANIIDATERFK